ncbi:MAG: FAD-dependent oxidoreductase [Kiritimatiellia bacterium]
MKNLALSAAVAALSVFAALADTVLVEAESFPDWGGWVNDTQFMDQMGSPYLLAHGLGKPVADARTTFDAPEDGTYDVWVRTKNWLAWVKAQQGARAGDEVPGVFTLIVNGTELPTRLGIQGTGEWQWVKAGAVPLKKGANTVALRDLDGFDGRCDALVFTTRTDLDLDDFREEERRRRRLHDVSPKEYDFVVVGGGIGGICTAVSAARLGLKVALVHDRPVLGGNNSSEVRVHLGARQNIPPYPRLGDLLAEFGPRHGENAEHAGNYEDERKLAVVQAEKNLDLFLNWHVNGISRMRDGSGRIGAVRAQNTRTGAETSFAAEWFADCTGDGTVGFLAGADYRQGRESRAETGESRAPEVADTKTMGASVQWRAVAGKAKSAFPLQPWMIRFDEESGRAEMKGDWDWEAGIGRDQIKEAEYIRDYGLLVAFSNWAFAKNVSSRREQFADKELEWVAYIAGRRESRRLLGDFILDEKRIVSRQWEDDATCACTWTIDLHLPKTPEETKFSGEPFRSNAHHRPIYPYPIPYRCLYSRNVPNLFMAGRNVSVTHNALGTARLMRTHGMMGEVLGMAAAICRKYGCNPRDVYREHLPELKAMMEKGVGDGKVHPPQLYNQGGTLDPELQQGGNLQIR